MNNFCISSKNDVKNSLHYEHTVTLMLFPSQSVYVPITNDTRKMKEVILWAFCVIFYSTFV